MQSINFCRFLPVGKPAIAVEFLNSWGIDEIIILDITASKNQVLKNYAFIEQLSRACFVPLTVGGGINSIEDVHALLRYGADKVVINAHCLSDPDFITEVAEVFGSQCVVVSIDVIGSDRSEYHVYNAASDILTDIDPVEWAQNVEAKGAGEIFLTSVDRDGSKNGYDLDLIDLVASQVKIPVIASGGAGNPGHILDVFSKTNASAVSASNFFHFFEHSVILTKSVLRDNQSDVRLNTHAEYSGSRYGIDFRLKKQSDAYLQDLLFEKIEKEII